MPAIAAPAEPFNDADLARLDNLHWDHLAAHGGMNLEAIDGFFSAMFVGPIEVALDHLIALAWVNPPDASIAAETVAEINQLIARYWVHVGKRISRDPESLGSEAVPPILLRKSCRPWNPMICNPWKVSIHSAQIGRQASNTVRSSRKKVGTRAVCRMRRSPMVWR